MTPPDKTTGDTTGEPVANDHPTRASGRGSHAPGQGPLPLAVRLPRRLIQLYAGLIAYAVSMAMMVETGLGNQPWDVFHQGIAINTGLSLGTVAIVVGAAVLLLWIPLRQRPGIGTLSNVVVIGLAVDAALWALPTPSGLPARLAFLAAGVLLNGVATGLYVGARLGPGPRDGLMTGLAARGYSLRLVRTGIELSVVAIGWLLGGRLGVGTIVYALAIGPLVHILLPRFAVEPDTPGPRQRVTAGPRGTAPRRLPIRGRRPAMMDVPDADRP